MPPVKKRAAAVFMNPDSTYSYALKEEDGGTSSESSGGDQLQVQADSTALPSGSAAVGAGDPHSSQSGQEPRTSMPAASVTGSARAAVQ